jgi:hypothetical protein
MSRVKGILKYRMLKTALIVVLSAESAFALQPPNAPRKFEISYTGNLPFFLGFGFVRKGGFNLGGACVQVAVRVTDSAAALGEVCGTHQFMQSASGSGAPGRRWPLSEPAGQQVDSLSSIRGGMRLNQLAGSRITTFVQALAGIERGYRHGGFADNAGFSFAAGGGVDISLTNWFSYAIARANYQTARVGGISINSLRFGTGPVFRIGKTSDPSSGPATVP